MVPFGGNLHFFILPVGAPMYITYRGSSILLRLCSYLPWLRKIQKLITSILSVIPIFYFKISLGIFRSTVLVAKEIRLKHRFSIVFCSVRKMSNVAAAAFVAVTILLGSILYRISLKPPSYKNVGKHHDTVYCKEQHIF